MLKDKVLLKQEPRQPTASGLILPDTDSPGPGEARYKVLAVGPEVTETIRVGDIVMAVPFAGEFFDRVGKTRIVKQDEILAVVLDVFG
jgi:co-chaperonin GroES (HSP10)